MSHCHGRGRWAYGVRGGGGELPDRGKRASKGTFSSSFVLFFQKLGRISVWVCGNFLTVL